MEARSKAPEQSNLVTVIFIVPTELSSAGFLSCLWRRVGENEHREKYEDPTGYRTEANPLQNAGSVTETYRLFLKKDDSLQYIRSRTDNEQMFC